MKQYISYGGGLGSTALICHLLDHIDDYEIIFVNHGADYPHTYEYVEYIQKALNISITELKPDMQGFDNLYDYCWNFHTYPNRATRFCHDKAKIRTVHRYCERPYNTCLGITTDEAHRARQPVEKYETHTFPLIDAGIHRRDCRGIIMDHGLRVPERSCCYICYNAKPAELSRMKRVYPELWKKRTDLETHSVKFYNKQKGQTCLTCTGGM